MSAFGDDLGDDADDMYNAPSSSLNDIKLNGESDDDDDMADGAFDTLLALTHAMRTSARACTRAEMGSPRPAMTRGGGGENKLLSNQVGICALHAAVSQLLQCSCKRARTAITMRTSRAMPSKSWATWHRKKSKAIRNCPKSLRYIAPHFFIYQSKRLTAVRCHSAHV